MTKKSSAEYQREYRKRLRQQGLVKKEVWVLPENGKQLNSFEKELRKPQLNSETDKGGNSMNMTINPTLRWSTESLFTALKDRPNFCNDSRTIEIIDGVNSTIVISMHDFGDLPIFLTVSGEQILAEAVLFSVSDIEDTIKFNEYVLKTHKYLPLSTISIETDETHGDYYYMFGALSASSNINEIMLEIDTLAENTIHAAEAFKDFLTAKVAAN